MTTLPRQSNFRHIFGEEFSSSNSFLSIKAMNYGEGQYIKVNAKYWAVAISGGGGPMYIHRVDNPTRIESPFFKVNVHESKVMDFEFCPTNDNLIASSSQDCKVKIFKIPETIDKDYDKADQSLEGHVKPTYVKWHPTASNVLACVEGGPNRHVKVWDTEEAEELFRSVDHEANIFSMEWSFNGQFIATTCQDRNLRVFDPRDPEEVVLSHETHSSTKMARCFWVDNKNMIGSTGMKKNSQRELFFFDYRKMNKPLHHIELDQQTSFFYPHYDPYNSLLYLAGKGDSGIRIYELTEQDGFCHYVTECRMNMPQKGIAFMPKKVVDTTKPELLRIYRLTNDAVVPVSIQCPRTSAKSVFQSDLYPPCYAGKPAMTVDEYFDGKNVDPPLISLGPDKKVSKRQTRRARLKEKSTPIESEVEDKTRSEEDSKSRQKVKESEEESVSKKSQDPSPIDRQSSTSEKRSKRRSKKDKASLERYKAKVSELNDRIGELEEELEQKEATIDQLKSSSKSVTELQSKLEIKEQECIKSTQTIEQLKRYEDESKKWKAVEEQLKSKEEIIEQQANKIIDISSKLVDLMNEDD